MGSSCTFIVCVGTDEDILAHGGNGPAEMVNRGGVVGDQSGFLGPDAVPVRGKHNRYDPMGVTLEGGPTPVDETEAC